MATYDNDGNMISTLSKEVLEKYPNEIFVETGTQNGHGTQIALDCGFKKILTIEIDHEQVLRTSKRFEKEIEEGIIEIIEGDTFKVFGDVLKKVDKQATFWLDAHWDGGPTKGEYKCPLPFELELLLDHPIKTHTILVDDKRIIGNPNSTWGDNLDLDLIIEAMTDINPDYQISFEDGCIPDDIIVASLK